MQPLKEKTALITGASRGIGASIALHFAKAGANVAITYQNSKDLAEAVAENARALSVEAHVLQADAGSAHAVKSSVEKAAESLGGRIDILVNNAGIFKRRLLSEVSDEEFDEVMNVNLKGAFIAAREAVRFMPDGGRIINIGSSFGERVPFPGCGLYATSKFAVAGLTRSLARDLAPRKITVNCIEPGPTTTDMNRGDERHGRIMAMMTAFGKYGTPEDVANVALFLASPAASYMTGACLPIDGGYEA